MSGWSPCPSPVGDLFGGHGRGVGWYVCVRGMSQGEGRTGDSEAPSSSSSSSRVLHFKFLSVSGVGGQRVVVAVVVPETRGVGRSDGYTGVKSPRDTRLPQCSGSSIFHCQGKWKKRRDVRGRGGSSTRGDRPTTDKMSGKIHVIFLRCTYSVSSCIHPK